MSYVNETFPQGVAKGSRGGPRMSLSVTELDGGGQERAKRWPSYRWEYDAGLGIKDLATLDSVYSHYLAVGPENSFPFQDPQDFTSRSDNRSDPVTTPGSSLDQIIAVGDGSTVTFQIIKSYTFGTRTYVRNIRKPQSGTVTISVGGVLKTLNTDYTLDTSTGVVTFLAGQTPGNGAVIRASYKFFVPVFYGKEFVYKTSIDAINAGRVPELPLVEDVGESALTPEFPYLGGGDTIAVSSNLLYDYNWGRSVFFVPNADGYSITLPDINELPFGGPLFTFVNAATVATKTLTFKNRATGATEFTLAVTKGAMLFVRRDTGGARLWTALGN